MNACCDACVSLLNHLEGRRKYTAPTEAFSHYSAMAAVLKRTGLAGGRLRDWRRSRGRTETTMPDEARIGSTESDGKEPSERSSKPPDIVVKSRALQVAQAWVKNMSGGLDPEPEDEDDEESTIREALRPARLGLGAKYVAHSQAAALMSPVEKKLRARINAARKEADSAADQTEATAQADSGDDDDDGPGGGKDSKTSAFGRKHRNTSADLLLMPSGKAGKRKRPGR